MHPDYVRRAGVTTHQLEEPRGIQVIDGRPISSGAVTHQATTILRVGKHHRETEAFYICDTGVHDIVLGISWLRKHCPAVHWTTGRLTFGQTCVRRGCAGFEGAYMEPVSRDQPLVTGVTGNIIAISAAEFAELLEVDEALEHGQLVVSSGESPEEMRIANLGFRTEGPRRDARITPHCPRCQ